MHSTTLHATVLSLGMISQVVALPGLCSSCHVQLDSSSPQIQWSNCTEQDPLGLDCGQIQVPLSYDKPNGEKITLFMARLKANGNSSSGSLIYNPGGPGGPGSDVILQSALTPSGLFSAQQSGLFGQYDIIGLDMRGIGRSTAVKCDPDIYNQRVAIFPKTEDEFNKLVARNKAFGESCRQKTGALLDHLDSKHVAQDLDLVRQALGGKKLNYFGQSYGTLLGTAYVEAFPDKVGRMVLDGVTDHSGNEISTLTSVTVTLELTLNKFFDWCKNSTSCALHRQDAPSIFDSVIQTASDKPIPAPLCQSSNSGCRKDSNAEDILVNVKSYLMDAVQGWPILAAGLAQVAADNNASLFPSPILAGESNPLFSGLAIGAQDFPSTADTFTAMSTRQQLLRTLAPHTSGISTTWQLLASVIGYGAKLTNPPHPLDRRVDGASPVLLVNSLWDPATGIDMANSVHLQVPKSVLIVRNGGGHMSYQLEGETKKAIEQFLVDGKMPGQGTTYQS